MQLEIKTFKANEITPELCIIVSNILQDAFEERKQQNIKFRCGYFTPEDVKNYLCGDFRLMIVYDGDTPIATASLFIRKKLWFDYGGFENLAVCSKYKGQGIAKILARERVGVANDLHLDFLTSATAVNAISSVNYHKKMGFIIYYKAHGMYYDSYCYIYPLKKLRILKIDIIRRIIYTTLTLLGKIKKKYD